MSAHRNSYGTPLALVLNCLNGKYKQQGNKYIAHCPCPSHEDKHPSLSITEGDDGKVLINCFAGCSYESIMKSWGLDPSDGFPKHDDNYNNYYKNYKTQNSHKEKKEIKADTNSSKRPYKNLAEYAEFKGVLKRVFIDAGWRETTHYNRPALEIPTLNGSRYRFLDGHHSTFINQTGFTGCWYKLPEAIAMAKQTNFPLILCNGEPSTVVAQHYDLPAFCFSGGETTDIRVELLEQIQSSYTGNILITLDNDQAGINGAEKKLKQLTACGLNVKALDFGSDRFKGFDLADFVKQHKENSFSELMKLPDLVIAHESPDTGQQEEKKIKKEKFDDLDFALLFAGDHPNLKYDEDIKLWRQWTGTHWQVYLKIEKLKDLITQVIRRVSQDTPISDKKVHSILGLARTKCLQDFQDNNKHLINFKNGTLDSTTYEFYQHNPEDGLCSVLPYSYNLANKYHIPNIKNYLESSIPDKIARFAFMSHCGLALLNDRSMHNGLFLHGATRGGKTIGLALMNLLCGSSKEDAFNFAGASLLDKGTEGKRSRALWNQHRIVGLDELPKESFKNEEILKSLLSHSGTEMRKIGKDETIGNRWQPKIAFAANDKPNLSDVSGAVRERLLIINFPNSRPTKEQNKLLLDSFIPELGSFAATCLRMAEKTLKEGKYPISKEMQQAFNNIALLSNHLKMFVVDNCILDPGAWTTTAELWISYKEFCEDAGQHPLGKNRFTQNLTDMFPKLKLVRRGPKGDRGIAGIRLRKDGDPINTSFSQDEIDEDFSAFDNLFNSITDATDTQLTGEKNMCQVITPNNINNIQPLLTQLTHFQENLSSKTFVNLENKTQIGLDIDTSTSIEIKESENLNSEEDLGEIVEGDFASVVSAYKFKEEQVSQNQVVIEEQTTDTQKIENVSDVSSVSPKQPTNRISCCKTLQQHPVVLEALRMLSDGTVDSLPGSIVVDDSTEHFYPGKGLKILVRDLKNQHHSVHNNAFNDLVLLVKNINEYLEKLTFNN